MTEQASPIKTTFDTVAPGYDTQALRFFRDSARIMSRFFGSERLRLLDVATGTGNAALELAQSLPKAQVTGVDFSSGMLAQARAKAEALDVRNVEFLEMDMHSLEFPDGSFDAAVCAFGIFFVGDMEAALKHMASKVRSGGSVLISTFCEGSFSPCTEIFFDRIEKYGFERPPLRWLEVASEAGCDSLFRQAGFGDVTVTSKDLGYFLDSPERWWDVVWNGGWRGVVQQLRPDDLPRFREEHLAEIDRLRTAEGIKLNVEVLYTMGTKQ